MPLCGSGDACIQVAVHLAVAPEPQNVMAERLAKQGEGCQEEGLGHGSRQNL